MRTSAIALLIITTATVSLGKVAQADNVSQTTITVPEMQCPSCAKRMAAQLQRVSGVANVQANIEGKALMVAPQTGKLPSPRAMWEAVERANFTPSRLQGPSGTFTSKPPF